MELTVGVIGCGTIGREVVSALGTGVVDGCRIGGVYDRHPDRVEATLRDASVGDAAAVADPTDLPDRCDVVVECAGHGAVVDYAVPTLETGTDLLALSVGALADATLHDRIVATAERTGARFLVPSGAIAGLDGIKAAATSDALDEVVFTTRKPPAGLEGAPHVVDNDIDLESIEEATVVFEGSAREAAPAFPANINVAMALSLAGLGPDDTLVRIIADPDEEHNVHVIDADGSAGPMHFAVDTVPHPKNPKTSYLAALSTIATLQRLTATVLVGT